MIHDALQVMTSVVDAHSRMQFGCLVDHSKHSVHSTQDLTDFDATYLCLTVLLFKGVQQFLLFSDRHFHFSFKRFREHSSLTLRRLNRSEHAYISDVGGGSG